MCCVMPPASPPATLALRMLVEEARLAVVDVTHDRDDRGTARFVARSRPRSGASSSPRASAMVCSSLLPTSSTSQPNSLARIFAVSASSVVLMWTLLMPIDRSFMRSSVALRLIFWAIVWSVTSLSMRMTFLCALISCVETIARLARRHRADIGRAPGAAGAAAHHRAPGLLARRRARRGGRSGRPSAPGARVVLDAARHVRLVAADARCAARCGRRHRHARAARPVLDARLRRGRSGACGAPARLGGGRRRRARRRRRRRRPATAGGGGGAGAARARPAARGGAAAATASSVARSTGGGGGGLAGLGGGLGGGSAARARRGSRGGRRRGLERARRSCAPRGRAAGRSRGRARSARARPWPFVLGMPRRLVDVVERRRDAAGARRGQRRTLDGHVGRRRGLAIARRLTTGRRADALLDDVVRALLLEVALDALDGLGLDGAHVVAHVDDPDRLEQAHDLLRVEVQLLRHLVDANLALIEPPDVCCIPHLLSSLRRCPRQPAAAHAHLLSSPAMPAWRTAQMATASSPSKRPELGLRPPRDGAPLGDGAAATSDVCAIAPGVRRRRWRAARRAASASSAASAPTASAPAPAGRRGGAPRSAGRTPRRAGARAPPASDVDGRA